MRLAALLSISLVTLLAPSAARADSKVSQSMQFVAGGSGSAGLPGADGRGVDVALIDSGVVPVGNLAEPGRLVYGPDFSSERNDRDLRNLDTFGHGTHLAGLITGRDRTTGFAGVAPASRVVSLKIAGADGSTDLARVLAAMDWIHRNHDRDGYDIRVVNLSLGVVAQDYRSDVLAWAVEQLWKDGIVVVAAAGNNGAYARTLDMPADDPFVIAAGASDTMQTANPFDDRVADFSSRSRWRTPDVVAPGSNVVSLRVPGSTLDTEFSNARVEGKFFRGSGTSQSAAITSALVARLLSAKPWLNPDQVKAVLKQSAVDLPDPSSADGAGRIDLRRALDLPTPDAGAVAQRYEPSVLNLDKLRRELNDDDDELGPGAQWNGRRWSGRRWSGRRWSGAKWTG